MQLAESLNGGRSTSVRRDAEDTNRLVVLSTRREQKNQTRTCCSDILPVKFAINGGKKFLEEREIYMVVSIIQMYRFVQIVPFKEGIKSRHHHHHHFELIYNIDNIIP